MQKKLIMLTLLSLVILLTISIAHYTTRNNDAIANEDQVFTSSEDLPPVLPMITGENTALYNDPVFFEYGIFSASDISLKENVESMDAVLPRVMQVQAKKYKFKKQKSQKKRHGFIAQELEQIFPDLVSEAEHITYDKQGIIELDRTIIKGINYTDMIPILLKAIQEQQEMILSMQEEIEKLKKKNK